MNVLTNLYRDGNDGSWSTFAVEVGTPPQVTRVLPSTSGSSLWVVLIQGCIESDPSNCHTLRGDTFNINASSTWQDEGLFHLPLLSEQYLGYSGNADYGFDNVTLDWPGSGGPTLEHQVLTGIATKDFYIGSLGMTSRPVNISNFTDPFPSMLGTLRNNNQIPSLSFGYTAGAFYQPKPEFDSLTFGGYDTTRFQPDNLTITMGPDTNRDLLVGITAIESGQESLLPTSIIAYIDSTVAQIWLPDEACERFKSAFGLVWNDTINLYLVNDTLHNNLVSKNPSITFTLSTGASDSNNTLNITLPYASFDLTASFPLVGNTTSRYFPLRRAQNSSQYTLGRTFLQESYLIVDYDRSTFYLSQVLFPDPSVSANLVPIHAPTNVTGTSTPSTSKKLSSGAIAGIAIACALLLMGIFTAIYLLRGRQKRRLTKNPRPGGIELPSSSFSPELSNQGAQKMELDARDTNFAGHEVHGQGLKLEMDGREMYRPEMSGMGVTPELYSSEVYELEGERNEEEVRGG